MFVIERPLMFKEGIMHLPELILCPCCFSRLGRLLGVLMYLRQREVTKDKAQPISELPLELLHDGIGLTAIRALIVAVFYEGDGCGHRPLNVIAFASRESKVAHFVTSCFEGSASRAAR